MFLLSARRVEPEVQCDDDKGNPLRLTRSHVRLQRHLLFLSVETVRLGILLGDLHSLQVVPALEWVLGLRGLFQTILLFHLRLGI